MLVERGRCTGLLQLSIVYELYIRMILSRVDVHGRRFNAFTRWRDRVILVQDLDGIGMLWETETTSAGSRGTFRIYSCDIGAARPLANAHRRAWRRERGSLDRIIDHSL